MALLSFSCFSLPLFLGFCSLAECHSFSFSFKYALNMNTNESKVFNQHSVARVWRGLPMWPGDSDGIESRGPEGVQ